MFVNEYETEARLFIQQHNLAFSVELLRDLTELLQNYQQQGYELGSEEGYSDGYDEGRVAGLEEARDRLA